jgi:hypothetical protein
MVRDLIRALLMVAFSPLSVSPARAANPIEIGIDRSNMGSQEWSLSPPAEPDVAPFNAPYNGAGVFEARRVAVFDGIARLHPQWFRDGFGGNPQMFVDTVTKIHERGMKMLAVVADRSDFAPGDYIDPQTSGCQWGAYRLSRINLDHLEQRVRPYFEALKAAGQSVEAFEIGNELDLYCNDADMPKTAEFAAHGWKWFLTDQQTHAFAAGYVPVLKTYVRLIRDDFPQAKIITFGMSNPTGNSAPLIQALAHFADESGKIVDVTELVDGYATHVYPPADTTLHMVETASADLAAQAAQLPHSREKPIWITEWNEAAAAFWSSHKWYFQYTADGAAGGDLNKAQGNYPAMSRAEAIRAFKRDVIERLRSDEPNPVRFGPLFYYSYDSVGKSPMCDDTGFNRARATVPFTTNDGTAYYGKGYCFSGVIDPATGNLLPDVADALMRAH